MEQSIMDAGRRRREEDIRRLRELAAKSDNAIAIEKVSGTPPSSVTLRLGYVTAASRSYPRETSNVIRLSVSLPARYPLVAPAVTVTTPVFHPNVYTSGLVCLGDTWIASETLDAVVRRVIRLLTFDPLISGGQPPANAAASSWYRDLLRTRPEVFPTQKVQFGDPVRKSAIGFNDISESATQSSAEGVRTQVECPACHGQMRLPSGKSGRVKCPSCSHRFDVTT